MKLWRREPRRNTEHPGWRWYPATAQDLLAAAEAYLEAHDWVRRGSVWYAPPSHGGAYYYLDSALREQARREATET